LAGIQPGPAFGVTKKEVDRACSASRQALDEYLAARAKFEEAAIAYEEIAHEVDQVQREQEHTADIVAVHQSEITGATERFQQQAVEAYMQAGAGNPSLFFLAPTIGDLITTTEFLRLASGEEEATLADLGALQGQLAVFQGRLQAIEVEKQQVEKERQMVMEAQEQAMLAEQTAWDRLDGRCREKQRQYEVEQARARAAAAARSGAAALGAPAAATPGFICPFPGSSFIDSWGYPRSGGRRHKGVDMFGPYGGKLIAVATGTAYTASSSLGGRSVWLVADYGTAYYYAHLSDYAVGSGSRVGKGDVVGYNGDSGNATGGSPHLHFEIHPGGRGAAAVNPYPTVVGACR
jgi:murein DD-endopeptidase MepM/ murein hydrolase activator NlpD